jgi:hypothetical protein
VNREPSLRLLGSIFHILIRISGTNNTSRRSDTLAKSRSKSASKSTSKVAEVNLERSWPGSIAFSAAAVVIVLTVAVLANLAIGRIIHWEIVTVLGVIGFVFLAIGRKFRTV